MVTVTHPPLLLIEDSQEDRVATMRAFKKCGLVNPIIWCGNGDDALDYLHQRGRYAETGSALRPGVILLDLNMPGTDGREVLAQIKQSESLKTIPVIVLSTSSDTRDIVGSYKAGASSYLRKPVDMEGFGAAMRL
jgi:CheY-like chemotaxis protein